MAEPVLERDLQDLADLEGRAKAGDEAAARTFFFLVSGLAGRLTKWQWVIHGDTVEYRQRVVRWLCQEGRYRQARRFALCGRGDEGFVGDVEGSVRIRPKGCGARFCPRCSRRFGRRFLSRVASHLSSDRHGPLDHIVLTQRVIPEEGLAGARERFNKSWKPFYSRLRALGMKSALATYHVTPSSVKGWHYHCHLLVEWGEESAEEGRGVALDDAWFEATRERAEHRKETFIRRVCNAGAALDGLAGERQMEFWDESPDPAEVVLQYMLRDILQGVEKWIGKLQTDVQCSEFAKALSGAKLHRLYGVWRTVEGAEDEDPAEGATDATSEMVVGVGKGSAEVLWTSRGSMDVVLWEMKGGAEWAWELVRRLIGRSSNRGAVALRLSRLVGELAV